MTRAPPRAPMWGAGVHTAMRRLATCGATAISARVGSPNPLGLRYEIVCAVCGESMPPPPTEEHCPGAIAKATAACDAVVAAVRRHRQEERLAARPTVLGFDGGEQ